MRKADVESEAVRNSLDWDLLEHLATDEDELKASILNDWRYRDFYIRYEADSGRCGDRQDRSIGYGCPESGEHYDPAAGKATARGQQKAGQPDEGDRGRLVHPDNQRASGSAGNPN